ncbi:unnamed protein product [Dibothriocephalus latus]|uniref:Uncharacterized protein n=1 Tax=Dibothriocephalus latus TaxID=60516 RepID=A0A3P7QNH2_DIBLA|nr:unnamed protein product [Dibothriocephalus latus]
MRIKTVTSFVPEGCKCTQKVEKLLEVCDCQAMFGNSVATNCLRDEEIEQATKMWFLVDGKCEPKVKLTRRIVDCSGQTHLRRVVQSACLVRADGVGRRNITVFGPRPKGCQCVSAPVSSISEICSCPQNLTTTQCMPGGKTLLRTHTAFSLVRRNGGVECLREVTQARLDPCVGQPRGEVERPSACNPTTCHKLIEITTHVPENCKCITKRTQKRETCCCPPPTQPKYTCNQAENILVKEVRVNQLLSALPIGERMRQVEPFCDTQLITTKVKVSCADHKPKIMMSTCKDNFRAMLRQCLPGNLLKITRTDFFLNASSNDCARRTSEQTHPTVCPRPHIRVSECGATGKEFVATETITNWTAVDCVCMPKVHQRDFICDCAAKFPPQTKYECKQNSIKEVVVTRWTLQGRTCVPGITRSSSRISKHIYCSALGRNSKHVGYN